MYSMFKLKNFTRVASFADDTKFYCESDSQGGHESLLSSISDMLSWSQLNHMPINLNKCHILHLGKTNIKRGYSINSSVIEEEEVLKDLGVWVDCTLKFSKDIFYISFSANSLIGLFKRIFLCITGYFKNFV